MDTTISAINDLKKSHAQIGEFDDKMNECEKDLKTLEQMEENVLKIMCPVVDDLEKLSKLTSENLTGNNHIQLDVKKWNIRGIFGDAKALFRKMTTGFTIENDLQLSITRMEESMSILIDIFDRIDSYVDRANLANYVSSIVSPDSGLDGDTNYMKSIRNLEEIIKSNLVLERYQAAIKSYKQQHFPIAYEDFDELNLPEGIRDTNIAITNAVEKLEYLEKRLKTMKSTVNEHDNHIIEQTNLSFYQWQDSKVISDLFEGKEIIILADVVNGTSKRAVKFSTIGIRFKLSNDRIEDEFQKTLSNFSVTLKMLGNNYYCCGKKIYYFSMDQTIFGAYKWEKGILLK